MSQLGEHIAPPEGIEHSLMCYVPHTCVFYKRDAGRTGQESKKHDNVEKAINAVDGAWLYLFRLDTTETGYWTCRNPITMNAPEKRLTDVLEE
jgi:hypothetical protein